MPKLPKSAHTLFSLVLVLAAFQGLALPSRRESGTPDLQWRKPVIQVAISSSLLRNNPNVKSDSDVSGAIRRSMLAWEHAANIEFRESSSEKQNVSAAGVSGDGVSLITIAPSAENVLLFAKDTEQTAAATRIFFDRRGFISEADIVLSPYQQFSTDGTFGTYDLESTLTHEIGHLLGLDHSMIPGATMYENYGKNGIFGTVNFGARTLGESDIAAVRGKYGGSEDDTECCGSISGKILESNGKPAKGLELWAEEAGTGKVFAAGVTAVDGRFKIDGIPAGKYLVFSRQLRRGKSFFPVQEIGQADLEAGDSPVLTKRLATGTTNTELRYIGYNGQLSTLAVPVTRGRTITVFLGGDNLDVRTVSIGFSSDLLSIAPATIASRDYGPDISVISFDLKIDPRTPPGEYSVFVESANGARSVIVGGIVVSGSKNNTLGIPGSDD